MSEQSQHVVRIFEKRTLQAMVRDMERKGYDVRATNFGYLCNEAIRDGGKITVMSAIRGRLHYIVRMHRAYFDFGQPQAGMEQ